MNFDRPRWRWTFLCAIALVAAFLTLSLHEQLWTYAGVFHLRPYFADLVALLAAGQAHVAGLDAYQPNPLDPFNRPHVYGPWWLVIGRLGLVTGDAWWLGALLGLLFVVVTLVVLAPRTGAHACAALLLLLSPPVMLGIERGNNDLVIFLLLAAAAALLTRRAVAAHWGATGALVFAALLKFYPLAALGGLLTSRERVSHLALRIGAALVVFAGLWWTQREEFFRALAIAPRPETLLAYGVRLFPLAWQTAGPHWPWLLAGYAAGAAGVGWALWRGRAALCRAIPEDGFAAALALTGGASWVFCYLANNSYPYRAVLLLLVVPAWLRLAEDADTAARRLGRGICALLLAALWISLLKWWWAEILRGGPSERDTSARWFLAVVGAEQAMIFALSLAITAALAGWLWHRWRAEA